MDFIYIFAIFLIPLLSSAYINYNYKKYIKLNNKNNIDGYTVARKILDENGLKNILIVETNGVLTDHYDPSRKIIRLSSDVYHTSSIASCSIAAHECGHAIQNKENYLFMKIRTSMVPIINFANKVSTFLLIIGIVLEYFQFVKIALMLMILGIIFQIITLPVEFNASKKAKIEIEKYNLLDKSEMNYCKKMLSSAALTYVAGLISNILYFLRLISRSRRN